MLELQNVTKRYKTQAAVEDVSFTVADAEFVTLLGPSGSGKSSILGMVAGFLTPDAGSIVLDGRDVKRLSAARRGIGVVFQHYALFPHLNVADNIAYGLKRRRWPKQKIRTRVAEMLDLIGLGGLENRRPSELSGGQQQRVALARALAFEPRVLLMDEPLGALDREIRLQMQQEIRRIHDELKPSILYVTHNKEEAFALSDRVGIMRDARLVALGTPHELYTTPATTFVAGFFSGRQILDIEIRSVDRTSGYAVIHICGVDARAPVSSDYAPTAGAGKIAISPHSVQIAPQDSEAQATNGLFTSHIDLQVRLTDLVYMGHLTQLHSVVRDDGQKLIGEMRTDELESSELGEEVALRVQLSETLVVSE